jgi:hypothetical protein
VPAPVDAPAPAFENGVVILVRPRRPALLALVLALTTSVASVALAADEAEQPGAQTRIDAALDRLRVATDELLAAHRDLTRLPGPAGRAELEAGIARLKQERRALEREIAEAQADRRAEVAAALGPSLTLDRAALLDRVRRARELAPRLLGDQARAALESVWLDLESWEVGGGPDRTPPSAGPSSTGCGRGPSPRSPSWSSAWTTC